MESWPFRFIKKGSLQFPEIGSAAVDELVYELAFEEYLRDAKCMNSSSIKKILEGPRYYLSALAGQEEKEDKDHYRFGRAAHLAILEPNKFRNLYVIQPEFTGLTQAGKESPNSKAAKEKRKKWREQLPSDALILTQQEHDDLTCMVESVLEHPQASMLLRNGRPEVTGRFTDPETGVRCKIRPDYLTFDKDEQIYVVDIKTTRNSSPGLFSNDIWKFKYHLQIAFYYDGIKAITGKEPEAAAFISVEKTAPYSTHVYWADDDMLAQGRQWYQHGLRIYKKCIETGKWPAPQEEAIMLSLPKKSEFDQFPQFDFGDSEQV